MRSSLAVQWLPNAVPRLEIYSEVFNALGPHNPTYSQPNASLPTNSKISLYITKIKMLPELPFCSPAQIHTPPPALPMGRACFSTALVHLDPASSRIGTPAPQHCLAIFTSPFWNLLALLFLGGGYYPILQLSCLFLISGPLSPTRL